ncbi:MAG: ATP-binding protein [Sneathiellales bacterium]|nr:ATP-binding protein [Sneathiellales bacterium]
MSAYNLLNSVIWVFNIEDHAFWWANRPALDFWECETQNDFLNIDLSDDSQVVRDRLHDIFEHGKKSGRVEENWTLYPSGKPKMVVITFTPVLLENGKRGAILEASPQLKEELDPRAKRILEAVRNTPLMISSYDLDGGLLAQNPTAAKIYGPSAEKMVTLDSRYQKREVIERILEVGTHQTRVFMDVEVPTSEGLRWHFVSADTGRDPISGGRVIIVTEEDITTRVHTEEELKNLNQTLELRVKERTKKLSAARKEAVAANEAKSNFLATMSHELRTPLNAIIGFSEMLENNIYGPITDRQEVTIGDIKRSGQNLLAQINDLLDASTIDTGRLNLFERNFPVRAITEYTRSMFQIQAAKKNQDLVIYDPPEELHLYADEHRMNQVMINLVGNAMKYTDEGGRIELDIQSCDRNGLTFTVTDTGVGISKAELKKVFQAFTQLDASSALATDKGVGLGLYISSQLMRIHGGKLDIKSKKGVGTTMIAILPPERVSHVAAKAV